MKLKFKSVNESKQVLTEADVDKGYRIRAIEKLG